MNRFKTPLFAVIAALLMLAPVPVPATDVDGPDDCTRIIHDMGDAPESIPAYPSGVLGKFPTCFAPGPAGTQEIAPGCPPISTLPGATGFVLHTSVPASGGNYWLGCYPVPGGLMGIDSDLDGKVNTPSIGFSACHPGLPTDCAQAAFLPVMTFDQDECFLDGSDAGLVTLPSLQVCKPSTVTFTTANCAQGQIRQVYLNILLDMNEDGDWNDTFTCPPVPGPCAYEWAVKNVPFVLSVPGCETHTSPAFLVGPNNGFGWMRISISDFPMPDDYPWNGTVSLPGGEMQGGETEDYPVEITSPTAVNGSTWGRLKVLYR
jgi:hypothetical protein